MSDLPPLVADGGELRLARRAAAYVYGRREVTWPEDVDDPEDSLPDEREFGWVAKLPGPEPGFSERRFVRGDVKIDAVENVSDVEHVLDDTGRRAGGDVFFESMIEGRGLGRLKPGVDFDEGDLVDVRFWGRVLPDQLVTSIEWHDGVPSVKIGGQLTSDTSELARARAETIRLITQERRERAGDVAEARSMAISAQSTADTARSAAVTAQSAADTAQSSADTAQSTADTARGEVQQVRDTLAGEQAQEPDLLTQLVAVNDELQRLGQEPQPSLMLAFVSLSTALWQAQEILDAAQDDYAAQTQAQTDVQAELINAVQSQVDQVASGVWNIGYHGDGFWKVSGNTVTAVGTWVGEAMIDVSTRDTSYNPPLIERFVRKVNVGTTREWTYKNPLSASIFHYRKTTGAVKKYTQVIGQTVAGTSFTELASMTASTQSPHSVTATVGWDAAHRGAKYSLRVTLDGVQQAFVTTTNLGPVFPWEDGYRTQQLAATVNPKPGQVIAVEVLCDHPGESQRTVRSGSASVWWVER